jgi:nuclear pore complex protein Nup133
MLSPQDLFYRQVSRIEDIFSALIRCEEAPQSETTVQEEVQTIMAVNIIILDMLRAVVKYREEKHVQQQSCSDVFYCWTCDDSVHGLRSVLVKQHSITIRRGVTSASHEAGTRGHMYQQCVEMTEQVLEGYRQELEALQPTSDLYNQRHRQYLKHRHQLIQPFLEAEQFERAASLAEKYHDFAILVQLCEVTDNQDKLNRYISQFADESFADFVFQWYIDHGKKSKLLSTLPINKDELGEFLRNRDEMSWIYDIINSRYDSAAGTLKKLAHQERDSLARRKHLFSLSKLSSLASFDPDDKINEHVEAIATEETLILYQETLPDPVTDNYGLDVDNMRVLSPVELIEMYIGAENTYANAYDFKKALDLIHFASNDKDVEVDVNALRLHIWCQAILRDNWDDIDTDRPLETNRETLFFRTIELVFTGGEDVKTLLPPVEDLLSAQELGSLAENPSFQFLMTATYEHLDRVC